MFAAVAILQYTGGTTGTPKGAMLTHAHLSANVGQVKAWRRQLGKAEGSVLGILPLFHVFAMTTVMNLAVDVPGWGFVVMASAGKDSALAEQRVSRAGTAHEGKDVFAFTRAGDLKGQKFARSLGAKWAGSSDDRPPEVVDAAIIFAPVGALVPVALRAVDRGGTVVCAGIHMSDIPGFSYEDLWQERVIRSVANLTREDADAFLELAPKVPVKTTVHLYPLEKANEALDDLRNGRFDGAAVLSPH